MKLRPFAKLATEILLALAFPMLIILTFSVDGLATASSVEGRLSDYYEQAAAYNSLSPYPVLPLYPGEVLSVYPGDEKWNGHFIPDYPGYDTIQIRDLDSNGTDIFAAVQGIPHQVARWSGSFWTAPSKSRMPVSITGEVLSVAVQGNGVYYGGSFSEIGGKAAANIAYWNGAAWQILGGGLTASSGGEVAVYRLLAVGSAGVIAAGTFDHAGSVPVQNIAYWDGSAWQALGGGLDGTVYALAGDLNNLYAGGAFPGAIAKWNGSGWALPGGGISAPSVVRAILLKDSSVYIGGEFEFTPTGGQPARNVAQWSGSTWSRLGEGAPGPIYSLGAGPDGVFAGGQFDIQLSDYKTSSIILWNGTTWTTLGSGAYDSWNSWKFTPTVYDLLPFADSMYVGGKLSRAGYNHSSGFASYHTQQTLEPYDFLYKPVAPGSTIYLIGRYFPRSTDLAVLINNEVVSEDAYANVDGKAYIHLRTSRLMHDGAYTVTLRSLKDPTVSASFTFDLLTGAPFVGTTHWGTYVTIGQEIFLPAIQK